jgi:hypothetical protein
MIYLAFFACQWEDPAEVTIDEIFGTGLVSSFNFSGC